MTKKKTGRFHKFFDKFDPEVEELATERFMSRKQIFDYRTHRFKPFIRDEVQARGVLLRAQEIAAEQGKELVLSFYEKKLLAKGVNDTAQ